MVQKWPFFQLFFVRRYRPGKCLLQYSRRKKRFSRLWKKEFKKSKNWHFSKEINPSFWSKNGHFPTFFLGNIGQKNVFYDILEGKNASLGYEKRKFKQSKTLHFSKGVNPRFWSNNGHISNFIFIGNIGQENVFYDILEGKNAFLGHKTKKFKKSKKIDIFPKGLTLGFGIKNGMFRNFF